MCIAVSLMVGVIYIVPISNTNFGQGKWEGAKGQSLKVAKRGEGNWGSGHTRRKEGGDVGWWGMVRWEGGWGRWKGYWA